MSRPRLDQPPKKLTVGYTTVSVEFVSDDTLGEEKIGDFDGFRKRIRIQDDLEGPELANTLLHEILHAVWYTMALDCDYLAADVGRMEEQVVTSTANGLIQVMRDNPALFEYLGSEAAR